MTLFARVLPAVNFAIGTTALAFQTLVLYPWHNELDREFRELEGTHAKLLREYHVAKVERLDTIESDLADIRTMLAQRRGGW
ncbi:hypothetical protein HK105_201095 [Polyrhizophydium stewartii]|uniref:Uncharacterized protein n=1 Tax=Polyrhizophydium stewartii TaxID=2732419 RepID=A0ABR4NIT9_9FUNG